MLYDNRELHYFEGNDVHSIKIRGRILLSRATAIERLKPEDRKDYAFVIRVPGRDWVLDPGTMAAWHEWEGHLRKMLG